MPVSDESAGRKSIFSLGLIALNPIELYRGKDLFAKGRLIVLANQRDARLTVFECHWRRNSTSRNIEQQAGMKLTSPLMCYGLAQQAKYSLTSRFILSSSSER
jgi:hypothetical protein